MSIFSPWIVEGCTNVNPIFAMEFLYRLPCKSQNFLSFRHRKVRIFQNQGKESAFEIGID